MKAESVHLVRVTTDDRECRIWAAATAREEAVDYVLEHIPEGWSACLLEDVLHDMKPGEIREIHYRRPWPLSH
jgi:hypothetical protein